MVMLGMASPNTEAKIAHHLQELLRLYTTDDEELALRLYREECTQAQRTALLRELLGELPKPLLEQEGRYYLALIREHVRSHGSDLELLEEMLNTRHLYHSNWYEILAIASDQGHKFPEPEYRP